MESIQELLGGIGNGSAMKKYYERALKKQEEEHLTPMQREARLLNSIRDSYDPEEYDCKKCKNRGYIATVELVNDAERLRNYECSCMPIRRSIWRLKQSGLDQTIRSKTFDKFKAENEWQREMKDTAQCYCYDGLENGSWFYCGGQPGSGKTHICTAIAREVLYKKPLQYLLWSDFIRRTQDKEADRQTIGEEVERYKNIEVLYIDDFFKPVKDYKGNTMLPGMAEVRLAFEIINYRYIKNRPVIISSEWSIKELNDIDEAIASRIYEKCGLYTISIKKGREKNMRYQA